MEDTDRPNPAEMDDLSSIEEEQGAYVSEPRQDPPERPAPADHPAAALRSIPDALAADLSEELSRRLRTSLRVQPCGARVYTYREFRRTIAEPTSCYVLAAEFESAADVEDAARPDGEPAGAAWVEIAPQVAFPMVCRLLGGAETDRFFPDRPLTAIERRVLGGVASLAGQSLGRSWPVSPGPRFRWAGGEGPPCDRTALAPDAPVIVLRFTLDMHPRTGAMRIAIPQSLLPAAAPAPGERTGQEANRAEPARQRSVAPLELSVTVEQGAISPEELAQLSRGDIVVTDADAQGEVIVRIAGIPKFAARLGVADGRRAVKIIRKLDEPEGRQADRAEQEPRQ